MVSGTGVQLNRAATVIITTKTESRERIKKAFQALHRVSAKALLLSEVISLEYYLSTKHHPKKLELNTGEFWKLNEDYLYFKIFAFSSSHSYVVEEEFPLDLAVWEGRTVRAFLNKSISYYCINATYSPAQRGIQFCFYSVENSLDAHSESVGEQ